MKRIVAVGALLASICAASIVQPASASQEGRIETYARTEMSSSYVYLQTDAYGKFHLYVTKPIRSVDAAFFARKGGVQVHLLPGGVTLAEIQRRRAYLNSQLLPGLVAMTSPTFFFEGIDHVRGKVRLTLDPQCEYFVKSKLSQKTLSWLEIKSIPNQGRTFLFGMSPVQDRFPIPGWYHTGINEWSSTPSTLQTSVGY